MPKQMFVATTKHQQEIRAAAELREQNFRVYLPKRFSQALVGRRIEVVSDLRFHGYIFVEFDVSAGEHGPINNTRSVGELIPPGDRPVPLPENWEMEMRRHIDEEWEKASGKAKPDPRADLHHGDIVEIDRKGHPANGLQGEYSRTENFLAVVHIGWAVWKLPEIDLRLIRSWRKTAA